jgi:beta-glucosidase
VRRLDSGLADQLITDVVKQANGRPVIVLLFSGRALIITQQIAKVNAWVACWLPGTEGGGVADVVYKRNGESFTGKLNHTWPNSYGQIPINDGNYGDPVGSGGAPLFPYGHGLTY